MALFDCHFHSESLKRKVSVQVIMPNDPQSYHVDSNKHYLRQMKALYLLHGYSDSSKDWLLHGEVQRLAFKYNLAIVLPDGGNNFYLNQKGTGNAYETFVGVELPAYIQKTFGMSNRSEDTMIGGYSMGGYGAIHTALNHGETFGKIIALSSALVIKDITGIDENYSNDLADYDYYKRIFGDLKAMAKSHINPEVQVTELMTNNRSKPQIYMACGTEDFLIDNNRSFYGFLHSHGYPSHYEECKGNHNWEFWNPHLEKGIELLIG